MASAVKIKQEKDLDDFFVEKSDNENCNNKPVDCKNSENNLINLHLVKQEYVDSETDCVLAPKSDLPGNYNIKTEDKTDNTLYKVEQENLETIFVKIEVESPDSEDDHESNYIIPITYCNSTYKVKQETTISDTQLEIQIENSTTQNLYEIKQECADLGVDYIRVSENSDLDFKNPTDTSQDTYVGMQRSNVIRTYQNRKTTKNIANQQSNVSQINDESLKNCHNIVYDSTKFQCDECNKDFKCKSTLKAHMKIHTGEKPFKCPKCDLRFLRQSVLNLHLKRHEGLKEFQCNSCDSAFVTKGELEEHFNSKHSKNKPFECVKCGKTFARNKYLARHTNIHRDDKPFVCEVCSLREYNKKECQRRYREKNREKLRQREIERRRRKKYTSRGSNTRIEVTDEEVASQSSCASEDTKHSEENPRVKENTQKRKERQQRYREKNRDKLRQREVIRRKLKNNISEEATLNMSNEEIDGETQNINRMEGTNGVVDAQSLCGLEIQTEQENGEAEKNNAIKRKEWHRRYREKHREELKQREAKRRLMAKKFSCEYCGKSCSTRVTLQKHMNMHTDEKIYECEICFWRYGDAYALKRHMKVHNREAVTPCGNCGRVCTNRGAQMKHVRWCVRYCVISN